MLNSKIDLEIKHLSLASVHCAQSRRSLLLFAPAPHGADVTKHYADVPKVQIVNKTSTKKVSQNNVKAAH